MTECNGTMGWGMKWSLTGCLWEEYLWESYSRLAKWNDCVDLWSGMKKPLMPCGAEVGEIN